VACLTVQFNSTYTYCSLFFTKMKEGDIRCIPCRILLIFFFVIEFSWAPSMTAVHVGEEGKKKGKREEGKERNWEQKCNTRQVDR